MEREECSHEWIIFPAYKQCKYCGTIMLDKQMQNVTGAIYEDTEDSTEDAEEQQDVLPKNDKRS